MHNGVEGVHPGCGTAKRRSRHGGQTFVGAHSFGTSTVLVVGDKCDAAPPACDGFLITFAMFYHFACSSRCVICGNLLPATYAAA